MHRGLDQGPRIFLAARARPRYAHQVASRVGVPAKSSCHNLASELRLRGLYLLPSFGPRFMQRFSQRFVFFLLVYNSTTERRHPDEHRTQANRRANASFTDRA